MGCCLDHVCMTFDYAGPCGLVDRGTFGFVGEIRGEVALRVSVVVGLPRRCVVRRASCRGLSSRKP